VVSDIAAVTLDDETLVTLRLSSGKYLRFQPDTGAQCNIIPVKPFPEVFAEEVGQLDGEYHIKIDPSVSPVQHPTRRVPVAAYANSSKPSWVVW